MYGKLTDSYLLLGDAIDYPDVIADGNCLKVLRSGGRIALADTRNRKPRSIK